MNIAFALDSIPRRMQELGYGENYLTRYRHVRVIDKSNITIKAHNQLWMFIQPEAGITVTSERGVFNLANAKINEQQHEHSGLIKVANDTGALAFVVFIQVIPKNKKQHR